MRKALFITERWAPERGGAAVSARRIASAIHGSGEFSVAVLHLAGGVPAGERAVTEDGGMPIYRLGVPRDTEEALRISLSAIEDLASRGPIAVFHGFYLRQAGYLAAFAGRYFPDAASIVSARGNDVDRAMLRPDQFPFLRWTLERADAVTCVTEEMRDKCRALADAALSRIVAVPNAVDADFFRPQARDEAMLARINWRGEALLGFFGELRSKKGPETLLRATAAAQRETPCRLLVVGGARGDDAEHWRDLRRSFPVLERSIHEVDYVEDRETLRAWYNQVDVALFPSAYDGMPNAALEAMACARPLVASDAGGLRELVHDGDTGFLASRHDPSAFPRRLVEALRLGREEVIGVGARAREYVIAHHSPAAERDAYLRIYRSVL